MNPWPDDYTEAPDEQDARKAWLEALRLAHNGGGQDGSVQVRRLGHYLHHLTTELHALQAVCDEQHAELARRDVEDAT